MKFRQPNTKYASRILDNTPSEGAVAQVVERSLSMREVRGSIPRCSKMTFWIYFLRREWKTRERGDALRTNNRQSYRQLVTQHPS